MTYSGNIQMIFICHSHTEGVR